MVFDILRYQWRSCPIPNVDTRSNGLHCNDWWKDHHGYAFPLAMPVITGPLHTMLIQSCNCYCNAPPLATCTVITFACARALLVRWWQRVIVHNIFLYVAAQMILAVLQAYTCFRWIANVFVFICFWAKLLFFKRIVSLVRRLGLVAWESIWLRQGPFPPVTKRTIGRWGLLIGMCAMAKNLLFRSPLVWATFLTNIQRGVPSWTAWHVCVAARHDQK